MARKTYPSDLTDAEWLILEPLIPPAKPGGRPRTVNIREIVNGIYYVLRSGCAWRMMPCTDRSGQCPTICRHGKPFTATSDSGARQAYGNR
jgi:transposase